MQLEAALCLSSELLYNLPSTYHMSTVDNASLRYCAGCRRNRFITEFSRRQPDGPYMKTCNPCLNWRRTNRSKRRHRSNRRATGQDLANITRFPSTTPTCYASPSPLVTQLQDVDSPDPIGWLPIEGPPTVLYYSHGSIVQECIYCSGLHWLHEKITVHTTILRYP